MNIVEHFVKTSAADQVFDLLKNKGAAFIKGTAIDVYYYNC